MLVGVDGRVRVADFGLARVEDAGQEVAEASPELTTLRAGAALDLRLTATHGVVGTPAYMAPEQHMHHRVDARADQYSFCAALHEALYGVRPYSGNDRPGILAAMQNGPINPVRRPRELPPRIHAALLRGLDIEPARRWPDMRALLDALDLRPGRARWVGLGLASLLIAGAVGARAFGKEAAVVACDGGARLGHVWDPGRRTALRSAVAGTDLPLAQHTADRVVATFDGYADAWSRMYADACQAHQRGEQSSELLDRRMACLGRRLADLDAIAAVLAPAHDAVVERAVQAAAALPAIATCGDTEALLAQLTPPAMIAGEVATLRASLSRVTANLRAGRVQAAHALALPIVAAARSLGYAPLLAEALQARGEAEDGLARHPEARATHDEAYGLALASGHDAVAAEIATSQVFRTGVDLRRHEVADEWARQAEALVRRAAAGPGAWIYLHRSIGALHRSKGELAQARGRYEQAFALTEQQPNHDRVAAATLLNNLANISNTEGHHEQARKQYERAIALFTAELGPDHPTLVRIETNLGNALARDGRLAAAEPVYRAALELCERVRGSQQQHCAEPRTSLGILLGRQGRQGDAVLQLRRAAQDYEAALGPKAPELAMALYNLGCALDELGELADARAQIERSRAIHRAVYGESYELLAFELTELGRITAALGEPEAARPLLEQALALREGEGVAPNELADTRFELARILWSTRIGRPRARELARLAEVGLRDAPEEARRHAEVVAWLAKLPV